MGSPPRMSDTMAWRAVLLGLVLISAFCVHGHLSPIRAELRQGKLVLDGAGPFLGRPTRIALAEMHDVSWLLYLPPTLERLSGYAAAGRRRGFFVLEELGVVHLLLDAEEPPFLLVRAHVASYGEQQLLLRLADAEATRELLAQLELALQAHDETRAAE